MCHLVSPKVVEKLIKIVPFSAENDDNDDYVTLFTAHAIFLLHSGQQMLISVQKRW